jgi:nitrogenase-associated protein
MAEILFYEKPGCVNNARQKQILAASGHRVHARDLLAQPWTREHLLEYLSSLPVREWFNMSSPRIKSGEVNPALLSCDDALGLLLDDHVLIRRPLMQVEGRHIAGFEYEKIDKWLGIASSESGANLETCMQIGS